MGNISIKHDSEEESYDNTASPDETIDTKLTDDDSTNDASLDSETNEEKPETDIEAEDTKTAEVTPEDPANIEPSLEELEAETKTNDEKTETSKTTTETEVNEDNSKKDTPSDMLKDFLSNDEDTYTLFGKIEPDPPSKTIVESKEDIKAIKQSFLSLLEASGRLLKRIWHVISTNSPKLVKSLKNSFKQYPKQASVVAIIVLTPVVIVILGLFMSDKQQIKIDEAEGRTLPASFVKESQQDVYYPSTLPEGYRIDATESVNDATLAAYTITNGNVVITLSQQKNIPDSAYSSLFNGSETIETTLGTAQVKRLDNGSVAAGLKLGETTVFLSTAVDIDTSTLKAIFDSIKLAND